MARTNTLGNFLTDVADAIRTKKGSEEPIAAADFDTEIKNLPSGGSYDWEALGFEEEPSVIEEDYNYALTLKNNWDPTTTTMPSSKFQNKRIVYMPDIDARNITGLNAFADAFNVTSGGANLTSVAPMKATPSGSISQMFRSCQRLKQADLSGFDTSNVTDMSSLFWYCSELENLDISTFNTARVTNMLSMFFYCFKLRNLDLRNFNTTNVTRMDQMFDGCYVANIDVSSFNTAKVTNMSAMFQNCRAMQSFNLTNFNTANVTDMSYMFSGCSGLTSVDLSSFNTTKVTNMREMFKNCPLLTQLDLSNFTTSALTNTLRMFGGCTSLTKIDMRNFNFSKVTTNYTDMFGADASTGVPNNCEIIVANDTQKTWITDKFARLTNVKTVAEYEAEQNA